ncbi:MAG: hypothetical protein J7K47_05655 [Thermoplasmata archaeon]|nr:hypothetical protein [Thermoplasmata archaeon]
MRRNERKKLEEARKDYQRIWEEVKPFIKEKKIKEYSTTGEWITSSYEP